MKKDWKDLELKIYELLGVRIFRKLAFGLVYTIISPMYIIKQKKEVQEEWRNTTSNYCIGRNKSLKKVKGFKKWLWFNAICHIYGLSECIPGFHSIIAGTASLSNTIIITSAIGINLYCIMLQRYNNIRINKVVEKMEKRETRRKSKIKEELIEKDFLLKEHEYKIVNKRNKEKPTTIEEIIDNSTYDELVRYRHELIRIKEDEEYRKYWDFGSATSIDSPLQKNKKLRLEFKSNKDNNS